MVRINAFFKLSFQHGFKNMGLFLVNDFKIDLCRYLFFGRFLDRLVLRCFGLILEIVVLWIIGIFPLC